MLDINSQFRPKSNWRPPTPNKTLEAFYRAVKNDLAKKSISHRKLKTPNISIAQRKAIKDLKDNANIIIKKADKGSAVVIMNTSDYLREGYRQLSDRQFYQPLAIDPTPQVAQEINGVIDEMLDKKLLKMHNF